MDRLREEYWKHHFPDPQEARVVRLCDFSQVEIYEGEQYIKFPDGTCLKDDESVLMSYLDAVFVTAGEEDC